MAWNLDQPSLDFLRFVNNNIQPGPVSADCILGNHYVHVCVHVVGCMCACERVGGTILFSTNLDVVSY